jgi:cytochrome c-type biogenesis protein CcmH
MLARSYNALGRFPEAVNAYVHLLKLVPDNADLLADFADTLAMTLNKSLLGEPEKLIVRALMIDPNNLKALSLSGSAAFERRDYQAAVKQWQKILFLVPSDSETARSTLNNVGEAQAMMGVPTVQAIPEAVASPAKTKSSAAVEVSGRVELDAGLRSQVSENDTVFIFARAAEGPRFPLVVLRKQVKDLPLNFVLDNSMSVVPNVNLSTYPMVQLGARISKSGNATPSPGDLEGLSEVVHTGVKNVKIKINTQRK